MPPTEHWPSAPPHKLSEAGSYMLTAATLHHAHRFLQRERLETLQRELLRALASAGWQVEAWAVFSNHYHVIAQSPDSEVTKIREVLREFHRSMSVWINRLDDTPGRTNWHNFWDSHLTYQQSYLARLSYVHQNAVHHGLVKVAANYPYASARWFEECAAGSFVKKLYGMRLDRVNVPDAFTCKAEE